MAVVDIVLPGLDGFSVCREARRAGVETPVLMLTAREEVEDRVRGLDAGADDYLVKPFAEEELAARLRSLARRGRLPIRETIRVGDLTVDVGARSVSFRGSLVPLAATEFRLFELLARNRGLVLSRDRILDKVWGNGFDGESNIVDVYVSAIRRKLRAAGAKECIRTSRGLGYTLEGDRAADAVVRRRLRRRAGRAVAGRVCVSRPGRTTICSSRCWARPPGAAVYAAALRRIALGIAAFDLPLLGLVALASYPLARLSLRPLEAARAREARFVADAAHELRTPLAAIATIAQAAPPSADTAAIARIALSASALVSDLLTLVRGEAVAAQVREPVGLAGILRAAVAELEPNGPGPRGWTWTPGRRSTCWARSAGCASSSATCSTTPAATPAARSGCGSSPRATRRWSRSRTTAPGSTRPTASGCSSASSPAARTAKAAAWAWPSRAGWRARTAATSPWPSARASLPGCRATGPKTEPNHRKPGGV